LADNAVKVVSVDIEGLADDAMDLFNAGIALAKAGYVHTIGTDGGYVHVSDVDIELSGAMLEAIDVLSYDDDIDPLPDGIQVQGDHIIELATGLTIVLVPYDSIPGTHK